MRNIWKFFIVCCDSWPSCKLFCMIKVVKSCEVWAINRVVLPLQIQSAITLIVIVSQCPGPEQPWANSTVSCTKTKCQRKTRSPQRIWTLCIANKYRYDSFKLKNCAFIISLFFVQSNPSGDNSIQMDAISTGVWEILQLNYCSWYASRWKCQLQNEEKTISIVFCNRKMMFFWSFLILCRYNNYVYVFSISY